MPKRKKIRRIISDKEVELEKWYKSYSENRSSWRKGFWLLIFSTILNIQTFFTHYYSDGISSPISKITFSGTIYCFFLTLYIRNNSLKLGPMKIGELYQKIEKNKLQVLIFGIPIITVVAFVLGFSFETKLYATIMLLSLFLYIGSLLRIYYNPDKIFSANWTVWGSIGVQFFAITQFYYFFSRWQNISGFWVIILLIVGLIVIWNTFKQGEGQLNLVQEYAIKLIDNERLFVAFRKEYKRNKDDIKALKILIELEKGKKHGVKLALAKRLEKHNINKDFLFVKKVGGGMFALILFILGASSEGIIQDLLNNSVKKYLCEWVGIFCNI